VFYQVTDLVITFEAFFTAWIEENELLFMNFTDIDIEILEAMNSTVKVSLIRARAETVVIEKGALWILNSVFVDGPLNITDALNKTPLHFIDLREVTIYFDDGYISF
jgi:hypothetical protein